MEAAVPDALSRRDQASLEDHGGKDMQLLPEGPAHLIHRRRFQVG